MWGGQWLPPSQRRRRAKRRGSGWRARSSRRPQERVHVLTNLRGWTRFAGGMLRCPTRRVRWGSGTNLDRLGRPCGHSAAAACMQSAAADRSHPMRVGHVGGASWIRAKSALVGELLVWRSARGSARRGSVLAAHVLFCPLCLREPCRFQLRLPTPTLARPTVATAQTGSLGCLFAPARARDSGARPGLIPSPPAWSPRWRPPSTSRRPKWTWAAASR